MEEDTKFVLREVSRINCEYIGYLEEQSNSKNIGNMENWNLCLYAIQNDSIFARKFRTPWHSKLKDLGKNIQMK